MSEPSRRPDDASSAPYAAYRSKPERLALGLVLLAILGIPLLALGYRFLDMQGGPARVIELRGRLPTPEHGGWTPETIVIRRGERVRLRLTSEDVIHGFAVPKLGVSVEWVEPGRVKEVELVAAQPGRYAFLCTVWCEQGHWRMRGTIEVVDPQNPTAALQDVDPPRTDWMASGIDLDGAHDGRFVPETPPDARHGAALWQGLPTGAAAQVIATFDPRRLSPSEAYARLGSPDVAVPEAIRALGPRERWDAVAYLWYARTTPEALATGARLYRRDCTGCHGSSGRGDGPGASAIAAAAAHHGAGPPAKRPADFTRLAGQAGAPDLLYYGKLVRGGMGTSMPYWGTIYREDELWAVIAYLRTFAFRYPVPDLDLAGSEPRGPVR